MSNADEILTGLKAKMRGRLPRTSDKPQETKPAAKKTAKTADS